MTYLISNQEVFKILYRDERDNEMDILFFILFIGIIFSHMIVYANCLSHH